MTRFNASGLDTSSLYLSEEEFPKNVSRQRNMLRLLKSLVPHSIPDGQQMSLLDDLDPISNTNCAFPYTHRGNVFDRGVYVLESFPMPWGAGWYVMFVHPDSTSTESGKASRSRLAAQG